MKVTIVPAQVTTIEDRISGSLSLSQILLLVAPLFIGSGIYVVFPPLMHSARYKLFICALLMLVCGLLAIRIKGKILLQWFVVILRYNLRPRYYVFNKNSPRLREQAEPPRALKKETNPQTTPRFAQNQAAPMSTRDAAQARYILENPAANLSFETSKKGGLYVRITEVREQG